MSSRLHRIHRRRFLGTCSAIIGAGAAATWCGHGFSGETTPPGLKAGAAKRKVTPPVSIPYLTSSGAGSNGPFKGVHDDLFARALVLDDGKQAIAILAVDSIGYDNGVLGPRRNFTRELRRQIARATDLNPNAVMLAATHAHSTPETIGLTPFRDVAGVPEWLEKHLQDLAGTVVEAWKKRRPGCLHAGKTTVTGVGRNRRIALKNGTLNRSGPMPDLSQVAVPIALDEELAVIRIGAEDGGTIAVLLNYTAHPVITMLLPHVSADYPGFAAAFVERDLTNAVCLFTQGPAGDVNSIKVSSSYEYAQAIGEKIGRSALAEVHRMQQTAPLRDPAIQVRSREILLAGRECPALREAERVVSLDPSAKNKMMLRLARKLDEEAALRAEVQVMRVGPLRWASLPGEAFVATGLALKKSGAFFVAAYANGYLGYYPIRRAYQEGGYEVMAGTWSRVAPGSAERLEGVAKDLLGEV